VKDISVLFNANFRRLDKLLQMSICLSVSSQVVDFIFSYFVIFFIFSRAVVSVLHVDHWRRQDFVRGRAYETKRK